MVYYGLLCFSLRMYVLYFSPPTIYSIPFRMFVAVDDFEPIHRYKILQCLWEANVWSTLSIKIAYMQVRIFVYRAGCFLK